MSTRIEFGVGISERLHTYLREMQAGDRLFVVSDPGVVTAGIVQPILDTLHEHGFQTELYAQVAPNPRDCDCITGAGIVSALRADTIIGIGGGSAMDTAKAVALLAKSGGTPQAYADGQRAYTDAYPVVCLPTTAGTGSEVTRSAVITEEHTHRKMTLKHAILRPQLALLDPLLTLTVPQAVTAATGVDALVHAIEGYTCTLSSPLTRVFGAAAMKDIVPTLPQAVENGADVEARSVMQRASLFAGLCFGNADVAAVHCLAEALGGLYDTPHGVANAIFLPHVLRFNAASHTQLHAEIARYMGFSGPGASDEEAVRLLVDGVANWTEALGIPKLRDLTYVSPTDFDQIVELAYANGSTPSNVRPINKEQYGEILSAAYAES